VRDQWFELAEQVRFVICLLFVTVRMVVDKLCLGYESELESVLCCSLSITTLTISTPPSYHTFTGSRDWTEYVKINLLVWSQI